MTVEQMNNKMVAKYCYNTVTRTPVAQMSKSIKKYLQAEVDSHKLSSDFIKNVDIAYYDGKTIYDGINDAGTGKWNGEAREVSIWQLDYNTNWNSLLRVWQKLRGELSMLISYNGVGSIISDKLEFYYNAIKNAITEEDTPTTAHRLIVEAIQLIKK